MTLFDTQLNILLQNLGTWLSPGMKFFSLLGTEYFFLGILPVIYWCFNPGLGIRMGITLLSTSSINSFLKIAFHLPRPYWVDPKVVAYSYEPSFGFPSGHAQKAASVWGFLSYVIKRPSGYFLAVLLILMIGISRLYLGVHFSMDVIAGWAFGFFILFLVIRLDKPVTGWIKRSSNWIVFIAGTCAGSILLVIGIIVHSSLQNWQIPAEWIQLASLSGTSIDPLNLSDLFSGVGTWIGFIAGACWLRSLEKKFGIYQVNGTISQKVWRYLLGMAGVLFIWAGFGLAFPKVNSIIGLVLVLIRFGLVGYWITGLAPYIFIKTGLIGIQKSLDVESI
jgi:membrane-associated phospholipid phosphatase